MELQEYLSQPYAGAASFINTVLKPIFHDNLQEQNYDVLRYQTEYQKLADATGVKQITLVAEIEPEDSINKISVFDITISDRIRLQRNRVGIQQLVMRLIDRYDGAFMLFHYNDTDNYDWRFTYSFRGKTDSTDSALQQTDSKRYTCLLGPNQSCRTAADNFQKLIHLNGNVSIQDIRIAFDVEALSNDFFNRYKTIYADIVEYVTGKRYVKQGGTWEEKQLHEPADIMQNFLSFADPEKAVRDYVKKLMGRLVFLCFLQKKGWMGVPKDEQWGTGDMSFLQHLWEDHGKPQDFIDRVLEPLFNDLNTQRHNDLANDKVVGEQRVPYLNGGLFEKDEADKIDFPLPPQYLQSLFDLFSQYNFTIDENDPNDIQVGIDPEMLGKIFENLLEDNKDKGAFYTPKEIVQYMCRESLIAYLNTECSAILSEEQTRQFITTHNPELLTNTQQRQVLKALKEVKICDPAIGSGAFPMGLLRELYFCRSVLENDNTRNTAAHIKKEIIQNNIYGVDIERGAVDIARLRFWLALVVDLEEPEALPNFDYKFMQGNSLLEQFEGLDLSSLLPQNANEPNGLIAFTEETTQQVLLQEYRDRYFRESDHARKYELREKINQIVKDLIKVRTSGNQRIAQAIEPINVSANTDFFLWHTWFADVFNRASKQGNHYTDTIGIPKGYTCRSAGGSPAEVNSGERFLSFVDSVGGSPASDETRQRDGNETRDERENTDTSLLPPRHLPATSKQGFDIVIGNPPYINIANIKSCEYRNLLKKTFYSSKNKSDLYAFFIEKGFELLTHSGTLAFIVPNTWKATDSFSKLREIIFEQHSLLQIVNLNNKIFDAIVTPLIIVANSQHDREYDIIVKDSNFNNIDSINVNEIIGNNDYIVDTQSSSCQKKIFKKIEYNSNPLSSYIKFSRGIKTSDDKRFILFEQKNSDCHKVYRGRNLKRYSLNWNGEYVWYRPDLMKEKAGCLTHSTAFFEVPEKIVIQRVNSSMQLMAAYDDGQNYFLDTVNVSNYDKWNRSVPMKYLCALINSRVVNFWYCNKYRMPTIGGYELHSIPIKIATTAQQQPIIDLVDTILAKKKANPGADTSVEEKAIDQLVYKLYDLNENEIKLIENS